jgi:hypothetical protein
MWHVMTNALMLANLGCYFSKNVFNFLTSKVDNFILLHSKDVFLAYFNMHMPL